MHVTKVPNRSVKGTHVGLRLTHDEIGRDISTEIQDLSNVLDKNRTNAKEPGPS